MLARVGLAGKEHVPAQAACPTASGARWRSAWRWPREPRLLFLDEPTAGLGAEGTARLAELVAELKRQLTIVIIEHDMHFLFRLADTHLGDPLGPGDRRRARRPSCARTRGCSAPTSARWHERRAAASCAERTDAARSSGIETFYGETQALFGVSLEVGARRGGRAARAQRRRQDDDAALDPRPDAGARAAASRFDGRDITRAPTHEIARAGIGWVPDDRRIFPTLTVARNLAIARKTTRFRAWSEKECFEIFTALEYLMQRECENLSGGEMQMVAISRALLGAPGLVLFDEPSQGLAPKVVQDVMTTIRRLQATKASRVLLVEQNVQSALAVADRVYVLRPRPHRPRGRRRRAARRRRAPRRLLGV